MIRMIYGADGSLQRNASPAKIDVRDLDSEGRPHPSLLRVGDKLGEVKGDDGKVTHHLFDHVEPTRLADGEREFDHVLSDKEMEREFPGYGARVKEMGRVGAIRGAVGMAAHDDELAGLVKAGTLKPADLSDLTEINARLKLRGKQTIGA